MVVVEAVARMLSAATLEYKLRPLIPDDVKQLKVLHSQVPKRQGISESSNFNFLKHFYHSLIDYRSFAA